MRIITANTNGIRAAARKGFFEWMETQNPDVVCIQETKAKLEQLSDPVFSPQGYHRYFFDAIKPGYSGTAIYCREKPEHVQYGLGWDPIDSEGRYVRVDFPKLSVISLYMPSGSSGDVRQTVKYKLMDQIMDHFRELMAGPREVVICSDWNIVHTEKDIKNWRGNQKNSGCLPEERAWLDRLFGEERWVDAFREINQKDEQYTWWSNRGQAWANNTGWRLDYQVVTPGLKNKVKSELIYKEQRFSDHSPLIMDYDI
ncbi:MAG: exodeoxyribonuclease III [Pseudomonadales bacterium]